MNDFTPIRILLVEDQQLIRRGFAMLLSTAKGIDVIAQAGNGQEALDVLLETEVDVVLADARMPIMDGVELTSRCTCDYPSLPVLILTTFDDDVLVRASLDAGASGFLLKDTSVEDLATALRAVVDGGLVIDPRVARAAMSSKASESYGALAVLTRGERAVAKLLARGLTNSEIAASLVLAEGTVKNHVSALLRKLNERDRTALALTLYKALGD